MRMNWARRDFVLGLLTCACGICAIRREALSQETAVRRYCYDALPRDDPGEARPATSNLVPLAQFPDAALVAYLQRENELLARYFGVRSELFFDRFDRGAYMNAHSGNYVALGNDFVSKFVNRKYGLLMISGILAHEQSHVFQVHWKVNSMLEDVRGQRVKQVEIHADYMAGAYMAWRETVRAGAPVELAALFYELGDRKSPEVHHGTSQERFLAFQRGYHDLGSAMKISNDADVRTAAAMGLKYVQQTLRY